MDITTHCVLPTSRRNRLCSTLAQGSARPGPQEAEESNTTVVCYLCVHTCAEQSGWRCHGCPCLTRPSDRHLLFSALLEIISGGEEYVVFFFLQGKKNLLSTQATQGAAIPIRHDEYSVAFPSRGTMERRECGRTHFKTRFPLCRFFYVSW